MWLCSGLLPQQSVSLLKGKSGVWGRAVSFGEGGGLCISVLQLFPGFGACPGLIHRWCLKGLQELGPGVMLKVCLAEVWSSQRVGLKGWIWDKQGSWELWNLLGRSTGLGCARASWLLNIRQGIWQGQEGRVKS